MSTLIFRIPPGDPPVDKNQPLLRDQLVALRAELFAGYEKAVAAENPQRAQLLAGALCSLDGTLSRLDSSGLSADQRAIDFALLRTLLCHHEAYPSDTQ